MRVFLWKYLSTATSKKPARKKGKKNSRVFFFLSSSRLSHRRPLDGDLGKKKRAPYLATSVPDRSSLGSGSVYPSALASATTSAKLLPGDKELKM